jgi:uncharacterized protein
LILDASGLLVAFEADHPRHRDAVRLIETNPSPPLISPLILAEVDYFLGKRREPLVRMTLLDEVARGLYRLEPFTAEDVAAGRDVVERHAGLGVSLADASICVIAERTGIADLLTLDERHFRVLPGPGGRPFRILPADLTGP